MKISWSMLEPSKGSNSSFCFHPNLELFLTWDRNWNPFTPQISNLRELFSPKIGWFSCLWVPARRSGHCVFWVFHLKRSSRDIRTAPHIYLPYSTKPLPMWCCLIVVLCLEMFDAETRKICFQGSNNTSHRRGDAMQSNSRFVIIFDSIKSAT